MKKVLLFFVSVLCYSTAYSQNASSLEFGRFYYPGEEKLLDGRLLSGSMKIQYNSSGDLYLLDLRQNMVVVYDSSLVEKFSFGGNGEGPGEFLNASDIYIDDNDNVYIIDSGLFRVSKFASSGEFVDSNTFNFRAIDMVVVNNKMCLHVGGVVPPKGQQAVSCYEIGSRDFMSSLTETSKVIGDRPVGFANSTFDMIQKERERIIVLQHPTDATISVFDEDLTLVNQFVVENEIYQQPAYPEKFNPIKDKISDYIRSTVNGIYVYEDRIIILFIEFGTGDKYLDIYNLNGDRLVKNVIYLEKRWPKFTDEKGNLYSFSYYDENKDKLNLKVYKKK